MAKAKVSIKATARREKAKDKKLRTDAVKKSVLDVQAQSTLDSFVNFAHKLGVGADNPLTSSGYGFNPITRVRTTLEWIHRGSWLGGVAVDVVADDMTRMGVKIKGDIKPEDIEKIESAANVLGVWNSVNETIKWSRLYGGAIAVMLIDGQMPETPLRLETVGKGQFKGLLVLDRWMVEPDISNLVTELGPELGLPKFYRITTDAPALPAMKIHYSRCLRLEGIKLPYWQRVQENLWGISVLERLYDRMIAFDSATTGAAQLVYKSYLRTYKIKGLRELIAAGGDAMQGLVAYVELMRKYAGIEGITLLDGDDAFEATQHSAFSGLSDALTQFGQQLAGALQIPLVRLFGQSPSGFNSGDMDLRMYYDSIKQQQEKSLGVPVTRIYRALGQSEGIALGEGFGLEFNSLWQLTDKEKAEITAQVTPAIVSVEESGLISPKVALEELRQMGHTTGHFTNISDEDIESAESEPVPPAPAPGQEGEPGGEGNGNMELNPKPDKELPKE